MLKPARPAPGSGQGACGGDEARQETEQRAGEIQTRASCRPVHCWHSASTRDAPVGGVGVGAQEAGDAVAAFRLLRAPHLLKHGHHGCSREGSGQNSTGALSPALGCVCVVGPLPSPVLC